MTLREEILKKAVDGEGITPEWVAYQTTRLYRQYQEQGRPHNECLKLARIEMLLIKDEALRIRRREHFLTALAPWCVVVLGTMACVGWWLLWE